LDASFDDDKFDDNKLDDTLVLFKPITSPLVRFDRREGWHCLDLEAIRLLDRMLGDNSQALALLLSNLGDYSGPLTGRAWQDSLGQQLKLMFGNSIPNISIKTRYSDQHFGHHASAGIRLVSMYEWTSDNPLDASGRNYCRSVIRLLARQGLLDLDDSPEHFTPDVAGWLRRAGVSSRVFKQIQVFNGWDHDWNPLFGENLNLQPSAI